MASIVRYRLAAALKAAWPAWLALGGIFLASALGWLLSTAPSTAIRYAGAILQIFGLGIVAWGLRQMRRLFKRPSLGTSISGWLGRVAGVFKAPKHASLQGAVRAVATLKTEGGVVHGVRPGASLEERVTVLEKNLNELRDELDPKLQRIHQELNTVREGMQQESQERQAADERAARIVEEVAIGGLHLEMVGLVWLVFGVLGTSIPDEIARWL